jgi:hypothetical protein
MRLSLRSALAFVAPCTLALALAPAATAGTYTFVAYGTGVTSCTIKTHKLEGRNLWTGGAERIDYSGQTDCTVPVQQTAHAWVPGNPPRDGGTCSGLLASCFSGENVWNVGEWPEPMHYDVTIIAPFGQGWEGAPDECSGVGSDHLTCTFTADQILGPLSS